MLETPEVQESRNAPNARRIDTHAHLVPDFYRLWLADKGVDAGGLPVPIWSVESTLQFMQTNEIETSILSVSTPGVETGDLNEAREMARRLNEFTARIVRGEKPGDLPVELPRKYELVINIGTAKVLGLKVPIRCSCWPMRCSNECRDVRFRPIADMDSCTAH